MSFFGIRNKDKRQFGRGFNCRVFVALFLFVSISTFAIFTLLDTHATDEQVPSVYLRSNATSYDDKEPGAWKVTKTAGWTGLGKARIVFNVDTLGKLPDKGSDILLLVNRNADDSTFNAGIAALKSLVNKFLDDGDNTLALVSFNSTYSIETSFTNDRELLLSKIDSLPKSSNCNIYQGLNGAERVLNSYVHDENRNTIIVLLAANVPDEEVLYQSSEYRLIKRAYPYTVVNAVQYRLGDEIVGALTNISDNRYIADESNIEDIIFEASIVPYSYEQFIVTDYLNDDYFALNGLENIDVSLGSVALDYENDTPKITWDLSEVLRSGSSAEMAIDAELKPGYATTPGIYPTNKRTTIISRIPETESENIEIDTTPILKTDYIITYNANTPSDCSANGIPTEEIHYVYETIPFVSTQPTCNGYIFKGWKIVQKHVAFINGDYFIMPDNDLTIMATWAKPTITKSMDGKIHIVQTLYDAIAKKSLGDNNQYNLDTNVRFGEQALENNGLGVNTMKKTANDEYPVHYFRGDVTDNNVLFADVCWKAVRTTSTGGVKLIYNGEAVNGQCEDGRNNHVGFGDVSSRNLSNNYYYGTNYLYDEINNTFTLSGIKTLAKWDDDTSGELIGQYTCLSADASAECTTPYFVISKKSSTIANVAPLQKNVPYYSIADTKYNASDAYISSVGYMFGDDSGYSSITIGGVSSYSTASLFPSTSISTSYWFADSVSYDDEDTHQYSLTEPYKVSSVYNNSSLAGKYTFRNSSADYQNNVVYYIVSVSSYSMYYIQLERGQLAPGEEEYYVIGDGFEDNGDGTYTLVNPTYIKKSDWGTRYNEAVHKYICGIGSIVCSNPRYILNVTNHSYDFMPVDKTIVVAKSHDGSTLQDTISLKMYELISNANNYREYKYTCGDATTVCAPGALLYITSYTSVGYEYYNEVFFGSSVTWDGSKYTLVDTIGADKVKNYINSHHFACASFSETVCDKVVYVYDNNNDTSNRYLTYVEFPQGITTVDEYFDRIFENKYNSAVKAMIDAWYKRTLVERSNMIEDTPYCNDRSAYNLGGWNPNGGSINASISFAMYGRHRAPTLNCANTRDTFTVDELNGNGKLTYPVGLLTADEMIISGLTAYSSTTLRTFLSNSDFSWTMTPASHHPLNSYVYQWEYRHENGYKLINTFQTRPVISIAPGIYIDSGDGSDTNPWTLME